MSLLLNLDITLIDPVLTVDLSHWNPPPFSPKTPYHTLFHPTLTMPHTVPFFQCISYSHIISTSIPRRLNNSTHCFFTLFSNYSQLLMSFFPPLFILSNHNITTHLHTHTHTHTHTSLLSWDDTHTLMSTDDVVRVGSDDGPTQCYPCDGPPHRDTRSAHCPSSWCACC